MLFRSLQVISRMVNNDRIWNFTGEKKNLNGIYNKLKKLKTIKMGQYGKKIKFEYVSTIVAHKKAGIRRKSLTRRSQ